jgi:hypothetical protein
VTREGEGNPTRGWSNRFLVRETDSRHIRSLWRTLLAVVIALAPTAVYLVEQNECMKISYEVNDLAVAHETLVKEEQELKVSKTQLESLADIEHWALRERGLLQPEPEDVIVVRSGYREPMELVASTPQDAGDETLH